MCASCLLKEAERVTRFGQEWYAQENAGSLQQGR